MRRRTGHPDFLDLPWDLPLESWRHDRLVDVPRGISRHVVRFVRYGDAIYALKELPRRLAEREYRLLAELDRLFIPVVEVAGLVTDRHLPGAVRAASWSWRTRKSSKPSSSPGTSTSRCPTAGCSARPAPTPRSATACSTRS